MWVFFFFWPFTDIILLLTYFTEVEQEAVTQENAMLQVNNVRLSIENIWGSCSGSVVGVVNVSSLSSNPGCGQCIVFLGRTHYSHSASLYQSSHLSVRAYM